MDRKSQEQVIEKFSGQLKKLSERIPGYFTEKDIHDWRVEYKKLRAFLRMITATVKGHVPLITKEIKKIYLAAGSIRELQLYISLLKTFPGIKTEELPVYNSLLQRNLFAAKEDFIKRTDIFSIEKEIDRWMVMPPEYLTTGIIKTFLQEKITAIRLILLVPESDENLHALRKHLKDIIYVSKIFTGTWGIPFPLTAWKNEKTVIEIAEELGKYNDWTATLGFLQNNYLDQLPEAEKKILTGLKENLLTEKKLHLQQVIVKLKELSFSTPLKEN